MPYRRTLLAGMVAIGFSSWIITAATIDDPTAPPLGLAFALGVLGGAATAALVHHWRVPAGIGLSIHINLLTLTAAYFVAAGESYGGIPTPSMLRTLAGSVREGLSDIAGGLDGVPLTEGLVAISLVLFWTLAAVLTWGVRAGRPYAAVIPALIAPAQLAVMDRSGADTLRASIFVVIVALALLAAARDDRHATSGALTALTPAGRRRAVLTPAVVITTLAVTASVGALSLVGDADRGVLDGRFPGGGGQGDIDPFTSIRQRLVQRSNEVMFTTTRPATTEAIYHRLFTLEQLGADTFERGRELPTLPATDVLTDVGQQGAGAVSIEVQIAAFESSWLPTPPETTAITAQLGLEAPVLADVADGSLRLQTGSTNPGDSYRVAATVAPPGTLPTAAPALLDQARYLQYDAGASVRGEIQALAIAVAGTGATDIDRALMLEQWFLSPPGPTPTSGFRYTIDIDPGNAASNLRDWLLEPSSPNFHAGYCENFATAMAVMARTLGIPSRVAVGFAPGDRSRSGITVRGTHAHAWVELWIESHGWVRFDPTPRSSISTVPASDFLVAEVVAPLDQAPPEETSSTSLPPLGDDDPDAPTPVQDSASFPTAVVVALAVVVAAVGAIPFIKSVQTRRRMRRFRAGDMAAGWEDITFRLIDLGERPSAANTPDEYAANVDDALAPLAAAYGRTVYGPDVPVSNEVAQAAQDSYRTTSDNIIERYTRGQRIRARYKPGTVRGVTKTKD